MTRADLDQAPMAYAAAARRAELQAGNGLRLSSFLTPLMNQRDDTYGGSLESRMHFPQEVAAAVR